MKHSKIVWATSLALSLLISAPMASAATSIPESDILFVDIPYREAIDIAGHAPGDAVAVFNVFAPSGGGVLSSLTIYTSDTFGGPSTGDFSYAYDLTVNGVLQTWHWSSWGPYQYLYDTPLMAGKNVFFATLTGLTGGLTTAPADAYAQFSFLPPGVPVPIPVPAAGVLLLGALFSFAGLRRSRKTA